MVEAKAFQPAVIRTVAAIWSVRATGCHNVPIAVGADKDGRPDVRDVQPVVIEAAELDSAGEDEGEVQEGYKNGEDWEMHF